MSTPPHDTGAELAVLGALLVPYCSVERVADQLEPQDFYAPQHASLYAAIVALHRSGHKPEPSVLKAELQRAGSVVDPQLIIDAQTAAEVGVARNTETVLRTAVARRVMAVGLAIAAEAETGTVEPGELVTAARDHVAAIEGPLTDGEVPDGMSSVDEFLRTADLTPSPWIVPGLLRAGWRCLVVAAEGVGKSVASRQIAIAAAQGVHPFAHSPMDPVRTLIVDLENPDDAIAETCKPITARARAASHAYDEGRAWLWRRPDGINLRSRSDRAAFERVLAATRPELVCLGPLYKAYRPEQRESDEVAAGDVQSILDDLRTRYGFALLMEHHAPKSSGLAPRDLVPYGSSLWLRWPELGLRLSSGDGENASRDSLLVGRFRRDRMKNSWPDRLDRGGPGRWPWVGFWSQGMDHEAVGS